MPGIDDKRPFVPLKIAVLTVSDTRELADDKSGGTLAERIEKAGHVVAGRAIVTDDVEKIREQMRNWIGDKGVDVIISTGGTGFTGRDVTPEAWSATPRLDRRRSNRAPPRAWQARPSSSACPVRPAPAATPGTRSWSTSSIIVSGHAISSS
jgi:molybdenum cofactor synthesis domain-containing protein